LLFLFPFYSAFRYPYLSKRNPILCCKYRPFYRQFILLGNIAGITTRCCIRTFQTLRVYMIPRYLILRKESSTI